MQRAEEAIAKLDVEKLSEVLDIGVVTIQDIVDTLMKPSRDPRDAFPQPLLKTDVLKWKIYKLGWNCKVQ